MRKTKQLILLFLTFLIFTTTLSAKPKQNLVYFDYEDKTFGVPYSETIKGWLKKGYTDICFQNSLLGGSTELNKYLKEHPDYIHEYDRKYNITIHIWNDWGTYCWSITSIENMRTKAEFEEAMQKARELQKQKEEAEYQAKIEEKNKKLEAINIKAKAILSNTKYSSFTFNGIENVKDNNLRFDSDLLKNNNTYLIYPFNISTFSNEKGYISKSDIHHAIYYLDDDVKFEILKEAKSRQEDYDKTYNDALTFGFYDLLPVLRNAEQQGLLVLIACDNGKPVLLGWIPEQ